MDETECAGEGAAQEHPRHLSHHPETRQREGQMALPFVAASGVSLWQLGLSSWRREQRKAASGVAPSVVGIQKRVSPTLLTAC